MKRRLFGQYKLFKDKPETEALKADYVSKAVDELLYDMTGKGIIPDWETMQIIVKEGFDIISGPDWYEEEKEGYKGPYAGWAMTVGIKFYSENYPKYMTEDLANEALELLKTPMEPNLYYNIVAKCKRCGRTLDIVEHNHCPQCGQKIDWTKLPDDWMAD